MKSSQPFLWALVTTGIVLVSLAAPTAGWAGEPVAVIVNSANPVNNLSFGELRRLFLSERTRWETGKSVAPVMLGAGAAERITFLKVVCGMSDADFSKYFTEAAFTGKDVTPPREVGSSRDVKRVVAGSAGAIGIIRASEVSSDVKAVKVNGLAAGDPGYKIK